MVRQKLQKVLCVAICTVMTFTMAIPLFASATDSVATPTISIARNYEDGISLEWNAVNDADGYAIYRSDNDDSFHKITDITSGDTTSFIDTTVISGNKYAYRMKAVSDNATSAYSTKKTTYRVDGTAVIAENQSKGIKVSWAEVPTAAGYKLYRSENGGEFKLLTTKEGSNATSFVNTSPVLGNIYAYKVRPYVIGGTTNYYNYEDRTFTIVRSTDAQGTTVVAPVLNQLKNFGDGVQVSWTPPIGNVAGYCIYKSTNDGDFVLIKNVAADVSEFIDKDVVSSGKYAYKMKAIVLDGNQNRLTAFSAKKTTYRIDTTTVSAVNQTKGVKVTWDEVPNAAGYKIYRSIDNGEFKLMTTKVGANATSYVNTSVSYGHLYAYQVKPYIVGGTTNYYNHEDNTVKIARLNEVTNITAVSDTNDNGRGVLLTWDAVEGADRYVISQKDTATGKAKNFYTLGNEKQIFVNTLIPSVYSFTVRGMIENATGPFSEKVSVDMTETIMVQEVPATDCNFALIERGWFENQDSFMKDDSITLKSYMITCRDAVGNVVVPSEAKTVVIENVDLSEFNTADDIVLAYTYINPDVYNGNENGVMYMDSIPYAYDEINHRITFEFDGFMPYYGNIQIAQGGHRDLVVDEPHGDLTWSVNNNCPWGDCVVDQNGRIEAWGSFDNIEVTAADGNKTWTWLINVCGNTILNRNLTVNVGETFYCYGFDDMRASSYISSEYNTDGTYIPFDQECGAIVDNGDGTATALRPGMYRLAIGFKYYLGQEGDSIQFGTITIVDPNQQEETGSVVIKEVPASDSNFALMESSWFESSDWFLKDDYVTLKNFMITYCDADGNIVVPPEAKTVVIENIDLSEFETTDDIVLAYTYIDPNVYNGNDNGVMYMNQIPYEYDEVNHRITFEFNGFQPYYGNIQIAQGGHRDLVIDEPHGDLTWSVNNNCPWGDCLVDQNGRVEAWGSFDNIEVTATDGEKTWTWLINVCSNSIINRNITVNVGETFYCYGYDDMRAGSYLSSEIRDDGYIDAQNECGAIGDNGDGTATALRPGTYNLVIGFKYFLTQTGYSTQFGTITIVEPEQSLVERFYGTWHAQGQNVGARVNIGETYASIIYANGGAMQSVYEVKDNGATISFFGHDYHIDEYGNMVSTTASGNVSGMVYARTKNLMGWWRSDASFEADDIDRIGYPDWDNPTGDVLHLNSSTSIQYDDYGTGFYITQDGKLYILDGIKDYRVIGNPEYYRYDRSTDILYAHYSDTNEVPMYRWSDNLQ